MDSISSKEVIIYSIVGIILLGVIGFAVWYFTIRPLSSPNGTVSAQAEFVGSYSTASNTALEDSADSFIEADKGMTCSHILYGLDDKYIYTWALCEKYTYSDEGGLVPAEGFSMPTRFEYDSATSEVTAYKQPLDGDLYNVSLNQIFPKTVAAIGDPTDADLTALEDKNAQKYIDSNVTSDTTPTPTN
jgi:hypothetical protein